MPGLRTSLQGLVSLPSMVTLGGSPYKGAGVPSWAAKDNKGNAALMTLDAANDRGWFGGVAYTTEAAFLTAIGGSKSGQARTIGPYVDPAAPELMTNGDLSGGITGWVPNGSALASVVSGELVLDGNGVTNASVASPSVPTSAGKAYQFKAKTRRGTSANPVTVLAAGGSNLSGGVGAGNNSTTTDAVNANGFCAEATPSYLGMRIPATTPTGTVIGDDFSVKEANPMKGWIAGTESLIVDFITPSAGATAKTIFALDDGVVGTPRNRLRVYLDTDGHIKAQTTTQTTVRTTADFGAVSAGETHRIHLSAAGLRILAQMDVNIAQVLNTNLSIGFYTLYIGKSLTGELWDGTILSLSAFASEYVPSRATWITGDSYGAGVAGSSVQGGLNAAGRTGIVTTAQGGSTLSIQLALLQSNASLSNAVFVWWDGDANGYQDIASDMAIIAQGVAVLGHQRFVLIPSCRRVNSDAGSRQAATERQAAIATAYPNNYYDAQAFLATLSDGSAGDIAAVAAGNIPPSCLQADGVHLTVTAMNATMANLNTTILVPKGW